VVKCANLHSFISRAAGAFGDSPADVIKRAFALAGLAVQAVGGVGGLDLALDGFIDSAGTKRDAGCGEQGYAPCLADVLVKNRQMTGLLFAMACGGNCGEGVFVETLVWL